MRIPGSVGKYNENRKKYGGKKKKKKDSPF